MNKKFDKLEDDSIEEIVTVICDLRNDEGSSTIKDLQPPPAVIRAMARAAAAVLIAFEHGYRLGD